MTSYLYRLIVAAIELLHSQHHQRHVCEFETALVWLARAQN